MQSGQRRGRWSGVPLEDRQALRRDDLVAAGVQLLGAESGPGADRAGGLPRRRGSLNATSTRASLTGTSSCGLSTTTSAPAPCRR